MKRVVSWLASLALALDLVGCAVAEPPRIIPVSNPPAFRPKSPQQVKSLEQAIAAIMTVCSSELGLPVVEPFYLHLYKDANAYAAYTYGRARLPDQIVGLTLALPQENRLHINLERTRGSSWGSLVRILAHEYAHNVEYVIIGGTRSWVQWIREGFADWVAAKVLDALGWESYPSTLARTKRGLARTVDSLPRLFSLGDSTDWLYAIDQPKGKIRAYGLSLLAVDRLIEKRGLPGMLHYFSSDDFAGSFGLTWSDFESELASLLKSLAPVRPPVKETEPANRPEWKTGYQWRYAWKGPGAVGNVMSEITREEIFDNVPAYVFKAGPNEHFYAKDNLAVLATASGGKAVTKHHPPFQLLSWPLEVGKEWKSAMVAGSAGQQLTRPLDAEAIVAGIEEVKVPAGVFQAFRIEIYGSFTGELMWEHWYAPQVRWLVKSRIYRQEGPVDLELVSYRVD